MWDWGQPSSTKRPSYLLLIGDHEDTDSSSAGWFLPTKVYEVSNDSIWIGENSIGDDDWYAYLDEPYTDLLSYPDMMVGRLPVRRTSTLQDMIDVIIAYEAESTLPEPDSLSCRREILHLYGNDITEQPFYPDSNWTSEICGWCGYDWDYVYGGDFDASTSSDGSTMTSLVWDSLLTSYLSTGQLITIYVDHGIPHLFSGGMDYTPGAPFEFQGIPDSVFNCFDVDSLSYEEVAHHGYPFIINACCATGRFCHTIEEHTNSGDPRWYYCQNENPAAGDTFHFPVDCIGEKFIKNTDMGAIGFFAASAFTYSHGYPYMVDGIAGAILRLGLTRIGDAIASMRFENMDMRLQPNRRDIALFNLLGDPALDLGDRVKFPDCCDLIVAPSDLDVSRYPTMSLGGTTTACLQSTIRNAGADSSGSFDADLRIQVSAINYDTTLTETFPSIAPGQDTTLSFGGWRVPGSLTCDMDIRLTCTADVDEDCTESWTGNNMASRTISILDFYPNDEGWPVRLPGSIKSPPALVDLDNDGDLDIIVVVGSQTIMAIDPEDPDDPSWSTNIRRTNCPISDGGFSIPVVGDVTGDGDPEVVIDTIDRLVVLDGEDGDLMCSFSHDTLGKAWSEGPHSPVLADIFAETGGLTSRNEIACVCDETFYVLRYQGDSLAKLDSIVVNSDPSEEIRYTWLAASELDGENGDDLVYSETLLDGTQYDSRIALYSSDSLGAFYLETSWTDRRLNSIPAIGDIGSSGTMIAISKLPVSGSDENPADFLDPVDLSVAASCTTSSSSASDQALCCMMVDWVGGASLDRMLVPSAEQNCVFDEYGNEDWYVIYPRTTSSRPPFAALGDIDDDGSADIINGIRSQGIVYAYDDEGNPIGGAGFPFDLPCQVFGGFLIADIDEDGKIEVVFGTVDNYLHVWQFDDCDSSYAPWPQVQHDAMRSGVLE
jgi:hypothetical protein